MDLRRSLGARLGMIAILTLLLLIPALMIQSLIRERQDRREQVKAEISSKWGESQTVSGPVISIPYDSYKYAGEKGGGAVRYLHFLPEDLAIQCRISPHIRKRGIFKAILYQTQIRLNAKFSFAGIENFAISPEDIHWENAVVSLGISDMKGIKDLIRLKWNDAELIVNPGVKITDILKTGIHSTIPIEASPGEYTLTSSIVLNGSANLLFTPVGKVTRLDMSSDWGNPSFIGNFLPEKHEITSKGFTAEWKILHLNRNFPQAWIGDKFRIASSNFGVNLLLPVDEYQKTMRTVKYAILFISLTFLSFFLIEVLNQKTLHPIQYLLIGFAILLFYTLLLSLSEHISFKFAYLFAGLGIIGLISTYTRGILKNKKLAGIIAGVLSGLYIYLYIVLQLQDLAMLMGSIGLFIALALVMYLTRDIDWYTIFQFEKKKNKRVSIE